MSKPVTLALVATIMGTSLAGCSWFHPSWSDGGSDAFRTRVLAQHPVGTGSQPLRAQLAAWGFETRAERCISNPKLMMCRENRPPDRLPPAQEEYLGYFSGFIYGCASSVKWEKGKDDEILKYILVGYGCAGP